MITRKERAKQFMPFDAMKGLTEALRRQEELHAREEKRELSEEDNEKLSLSLSKLRRGDGVEIRHYQAFHYALSRGEITKINYTYRFLCVGEQKIYFDDIHDLRLI